MDARTNLPEIGDIVGKLESVFALIAGAAHQAPLSDVAKAVTQAAEDGKLALDQLQMIIQPRALVLEEGRAGRLMDTYFDAFNANTSLRSAMSLFPVQQMAEPGEMDLHVTVDAFTNVIKASMDRMLQILNREEPGVDV
jgi:hypothetical protein